ncbi:MAG: hypothetical protein WEC72_01465 [Chthoniobacterales bacterium]
MKTILPKCLVLLALAALSLSDATAQSLEQRIETAAKNAISEGIDPAKAEAIARDLGEAFGPAEDSDALLQAVEKMASQTPDDTVAIASAATAFNPTPDFAARVAAVAARVAQEGTADSGGSGGGGGGSAPNPPTGFGGGGSSSGNGDS